MRLWEENAPAEEEEQVQKKNWKTEIKEKTAAIMGGQDRGECLVLSFNLGNSKNLRQDYGLAIRYLQGMFKAKMLDFKRFGLVFWDDENATAFGPYPFNSNRNMKSFIFNKMQMVMKKRKESGDEQPPKESSYDLALCPFFKNSKIESEAAGQLAAFRQKVSMIVVFTGSELADSEDPVAKAWARRMRDRTIYILKQGSLGKAKDLKKFDPTWRRHYILIPKGGSAKNEEFDFDLEEYDLPDYNRFDEYFGFSSETDSLQESYEKGFTEGFRAFQEIKESMTEKDKEKAFVQTFSEKVAEALRKAADLDAKQEKELRDNLFARIKASNEITRSLQSLVTHAAPAMESEILDEAMADTAFLTAVGKSILPTLQGMVSVTLQQINLELPFVAVMTAVITALYAACLAYLGAFGLYEKTKGWGEKVLRKFFPKSAKA